MDNPSPQWTHIIDTSINSHYNDDQLISAIGVLEKAHLWSLRFEQMIFAVKSIELIGRWWKEISIYTSTINEQCLIVKSSMTVKKYVDAIWHAPK